EQQPDKPAPDTSDNALLKMAQQQRQLAEQQTATVVDETIRRSKAMLNGDPDGAYDLLKRQRASILDNPEIGDKVKQSLLGRLDAQLRDVDNRGRAIKQRLEEESQKKVIMERNRTADAERDSLQQRTRERVRAFVTLMNQARSEEAYKEAQVMREEVI